MCFPPVFNGFGCICASPPYVPSLLFSFFLQLAGVAVNSFSFVLVSGPLCFAVEGFKLTASVVSNHVYCSLGILDQNIWCIFAYNIIL